MHEGIGARVEGASTGCGQLVNGRVLHCQRKMGCRQHGGSSRMKMQLTEWELDLSMGFAPLAPGEVLADRHSGDSCWKRV